MKLNGVNINIAPYVSEDFEEETVIYNEDAKKIVVLNCMATLIWSEVIKNSTENNDMSSSDIVNTIIDKCIGSIPEEQLLYNDVNETLELLFEAGLLQRA